MKIRKSLPESEYDIDGATFNLRQLSELELEQVNFLLLESLKAGHQVLPPSAVKYCLDRGLIGWHNVENEDGGQTKFSKEELKFLPWKARMELASEIYLKSQLTEEEKKT